MKNQNTFQFLKSFFFSSRVGKKKLLFFKKTSKTPSLCRVLTLSILLNNII
jgi:hypothetical protein